MRQDPMHEDPTHEDPTRSPSTAPAAGADFRQREAERLFPQLAIQLREVFYIHNGRGEEILFVSPAYEEVWGRPRDPLFVDGSAWMQAIHPEDRRRVEESWWRDCTTGRFSEEYRIIRPDGSIRWIADRCTPIEDGAGRIHRIVGIAEDITERRLAMQEMSEARAAAESAYRAMSEFLANVTHDLRTPMTSILGQAELMLEAARDEAAPADRLDGLRSIRRCGTYLLRLIEDLVAVSRLEAGGVRIERAECAPRRILEDVRSMMERVAASKGLRLDTSCDASVPEKVITDPTRLRQILTNLVDNACRFTEKGFVSLSLRWVGGMLCFEVNDSGIGIPEDHVDRVFEPLYRVPRSGTGSGQGTGLGLTIAQRLCRALGGLIEVSSRPGRGTTFHVYIPAEDAQQAAGGSGGAG